MANVPTYNQRRDIQLDAESLEQYLWLIEHTIPNKHKGLWSKILDDAGFLCDRIYEAYDIPKELDDAKYHALCAGYTALRRIQRRVIIANLHNVNAIDNDTKARIDILSNKVLTNLQGWSNSIKKRLSRQIPEAATPKGENS